MAESGVLGDGSARETARPDVSFIVGGRRMVQPATGGAVRPATEAERARVQTTMAAMPSRTSADGALVWTLPAGLGYQTDGQTAVKGRDGKPVLSSNAIAQALDSSGAMHFGGWLPETECFVVTVHYHIAGQNTWTRAGLDARTGKLISFNGWIAPDGRRAVVPGGKRLAVSSSWRAEVYDRSGKVVGHKPAFLTPDCWVVTLPATPLAYRFEDAAKKPLRHDGKPFGLRLTDALQFSRDGRWALCSRTDRVHDDRTGKGYDSPVAYLIALETGQVRKLPGSEAAFLDCAETPKATATPLAPPSDAEAQSLMRAFTAAILARDGKKVLSFFAPGRDLLLTNTLRPETERTEMATVPYAELQAGLGKKGSDWHDFFFRVRGEDEDPGVDLYAAFRQCRGKPWKQTAPGTLRAPLPASWYGGLPVYLQWSRINGAWKVTAIGFPQS